jgi:hypothetical protein
MLFSHGDFVSPWKGQVILQIENLTRRLSHAFCELSNETPFVSGDLLLMEISKFCCLKFAFVLQFCHGILVSPWRGQVSSPITNPTTWLFYSFYELSNETSFISGDLFFMEIQNFEVQGISNDFLKFLIRFKSPFSLPVSFCLPLPPTETLLLFLLVLTMAHLAGNAQDRS